MRIKSSFKCTCHCYSSDLLSLDPHLGPYPFDHPTQYQHWKNLSSYIHADHLTKLLSHQHGLISSMSDSNYKNGLPDGSTDDKVHFTQIPIKHSFSKNASVGDITKYSKDKSWLLRNLLQNSFNNSTLNHLPTVIFSHVEYAMLIGEIQFSFILVFLMQNYEGLEQWKRIIALALMADECIMEAKYADFYVDLCHVLKHQLEQIPLELMDDFLGFDSFLTLGLQVGHLMQCEVYVHNGVELGSNCPFAIE